MNQRKVKVPSATQAAMQDKTLRPPTKKESPPLGPAWDTYKDVVKHQQSVSSFTDPIQQLPADETDVALMVAPFGSLSKPLQNFAKKLVQTKTVKEGVDLALRQITGLGWKAQDIVDFSKKLLDIQTSVPGGMDAIKPKHLKALRLANEELVGIKDRGRRSVEAGRHLSAPEGSPHPASGAKEVEVKYDALGNKVDGTSQAVPKNIKDVNQPGVDEAFDESLDEAKRQKNKEAYEKFMEDLPENKENYDRFLKYRFGKVSDEKLLKRYEKEKVRKLRGRETESDRARRLRDFEAEISARGLD